MYPLLLKASGLRLEAFRVSGTADFLSVFG
jgi:hypothetical protein